jgi:YD repeat-containing protein
MRLTPLILALPAVSAAATCTTAPARNQPPTVFTCLGGLCIDSSDAPAGAACPRYTEATGGGTAAKFYTCSVANYYAHFARYFGQLTFSGAAVQRTRTTHGEIVNVTLTWNSESNGRYVALLQSALPVDPCPSYWVVAKAAGDGDASGDSGHSIDPATGNVHLTATDIEFFGPPGSIVFRRFYDSGDSAGVDGAPGWRHSYSRRIDVGWYGPGSAYPGKSGRASDRFPTPAAACTTGFAQIRSAVPAWADATAQYDNGICVLTRAAITIATLPIAAYPLPEAPARPLEYEVIRDDGQVLRYTTQDGLRPQPGVAIRLAVTESGYTVIDEEDSVEVYDRAGTLQSVTSRAGLVQRVAHDSDGRFSGVTDTFGDSINVVRNAPGSIAGITANGGGSVVYAYDDFSRLSMVTNPDGTTNTYVYDDPLFLNALTSIVDAAGAIAGHWAYDSHERATTSYGSGGAGAVSFVYAEDDGAVASTDALGIVRQLRYTRIGDVDKVAGTDATASTYDDHGWLASRIDEGRLECRANDPQRGLELVRVEGLAAGSRCPPDLAAYEPAANTGERKISTTWDPHFRLPRSIREPGRVTAFRYDASGNPVEKTITDTRFTPNKVQTWRTTYNAHGQEQSVDGPPSGIAVPNRWSYYECTTGSPCGRLHWVADSRGQRTTFRSYNAYGEPLIWTNPSGVSSLTYDARGRVRSRQTASEKLSLSYGATGLLELVELPDGRMERFHYDDAHRLNALSDGAGNSISYTLDPAGRLMAIDRQDAKHTLESIDARVFDALDELRRDLRVACPGAWTELAPVKPR